MLLVLLFAMIFCHVVDDYYLQGVLAKLKQKESWPQDKPQYRHDYIAALAAHAFSWAFMILLPLLTFGIANNYDPLFFYVWYPCVFILNTFIHAFVDNEKANEKSINLVTDQIIHMIQIIMTYGVFLTYVLNH